jgi:uncharacterized membrane protein YqaE (UPF0057 family)
MCLYILGFLIPPLAVLLDRGCGADFLINIGLSLLAWIPGVIHAWYIISRSERIRRVAKNTTVVT